MKTKEGNFRDVNILHLELNFFHHILMTEDMFFLLMKFKDTRKIATYRENILEQ
jgi:hypothetical protein